MQNRTTKTAPARSGRRSAVIVCVGVAFGLAVGLLMFWMAGRRFERASGAIPQQVYIWQRDWNGAVKTAVDTHGPQFETLVVLAAEVAWTGAQPHVVRAFLDYPSLRRAQRPVGLAIRLGAYGGSFEDPATLSLIGDLAAGVLRDAAAAEVNVAELQLDFDAGTAQLDGYRRWVAQVRNVAAPAAVTITALPSWMRSGAFGRLIAETDGYVLQVHSLERPIAIGEAAPLCDPERAAAWVRQAARYGVPFRVALPTYGYDLAFDAAGSYLGLSADGPRRRWPPGTTLRRLEADPAAMAGLIRKWTERRPALMTGVIWYRLPVAGERLNWPWPTLAAVMGGVVPAGHLEVTLRRPERGLIEVELYNSGSAPATVSGAVTLHWSADASPMADALGAFQLQRPDSRSIEYRSASRAGIEPLRPGDRRAIGWVRFDRPMEVHVDQRFR